MNDIADGRLTLLSDTPYTGQDVIGATAIMYTPAVGNQLALYYLGSWLPYTFTEPSLALSGLTSGKNYDVFAYNHVAGEGQTAPSVRSAATTNGVAAGNVALNLPPTFSAGDTLVLFYAGKGLTLNTPAGWTPETTNVISSTYKFGCYVRVATGTEGSTVNVNIGSGAYVAYAVAISNATAEDVHVSHAAIGSPSNVIPTAATLGVNRRLLSCYYWYATGGTQTINLPASQTSFGQVDQADGADTVSMKCGAEVIAALGDFGTRAGTTTTTATPTAGFGIEIVYGPTDPTAAGVYLSLSNPWTDDVTRADALAKQDGVFCLGSNLRKRYVGTIRATGATTTEDSLANRNVFDFVRPMYLPTTGTERLYFDGYR